jgi:hypothetical protein
VWLIKRCLSYFGLCEAILIIIMKEYPAPNDLIAVQKSIDFTKLLLQDTQLMNRNDCRFNLLRAFVLSIYKIF